MSLQQYNLRAKLGRFLIVASIAWRYTFVLSGVSGACPYDPFLASYIVAFHTNCMSCRVRQSHAYACFRLAAQKNPVPISLTSERAFFYKRAQTTRFIASLYFLRAARRHPQQYVFCCLCGLGPRPDHSTRPYFTLMRSSFCSMGSATNHKNSQVAAACTQSMGNPET